MELSEDVHLVHRGNQLARSEIAGSAEDDEDAGVGGEHGKMRGYRRHEMRARPNFSGKRSIKARMELPRNFAKAGLVDVGVNLRGHDTAVTEEFLHGAQIAAAAEEIGRETVS